MNSLLNQITAIGESVQVSSVKFPGHLTLDTGIAVLLISGFINLPVFNLFFY